jgi:IstB-like ATP binding protein
MSLRTRAENQRASARDHVRRRVRKGKVVGLGYLPIDKRGADLLFQVVAARYETGSIVLTTNRPFRDWGALFDVDNTLATALIDRLMHHGEALVIQGDRGIGTRVDLGLIGFLPGEPAYRNDR